MSEVPLYRSQTRVLQRQACGRRQGTPARSWARMCTHGEDSCDQRALRVPPDESRGWANLRVQGEHLGNVKSPRARRLLPVQDPKQERRLTRHRVTPTAVLLPLRPSAHSPLPVRRCRPVAGASRAGVGPPFLFLFVRKHLLLRRTAYFRWRLRSRLPLAPRRDTGGSPRSLVETC